MKRLSRLSGPIASSSGRSRHPALSSRIPTHLIRTSPALAHSRRFTTSPRNQNIPGKNPQNNKDGKSTAGQNDGPGNCSPEDWKLFLQFKERYKIFGFINIEDDMLKVERYVKAHGLSPEVRKALTEVLHPENTGIISKLWTVSKVSTVMIDFMTKATQEDVDQEPSNPMAQTLKIDAEQPVAKSEQSKIEPNLESQTSSSKASSPAEWQSSAEDRELFEWFAHMSKDVNPSGMDSELHALERYVKKHGFPADIRKVLQELSSSKDIGLPEGISLLSKGLWPALKFAKAVAQNEAEAQRQGINFKPGESKSNSEPQQKTTHEPGPNGQKKKQKEESGGFSFGGSFKLDLNTILFAAFSTWIFSSLVIPSESSKEITWQELRTTFLSKGLVEKIVVMNHTRAKVYLHREAVASLYPESPAVGNNFFYYFSIGSVEAFERRLDDAQAEMDIPASERIPVAYQDEGPWLGAILLNFGPTLLFVGALYLLSRRAGSSMGGSNSGIFGMGRSRAKQFNQETDVKVKFADVAGMDEAKAEIMEFVSFLREPGIYQKLGAKIPRGAILSGPPGTGKTLIAKATAGESGVPFYSVSGSEFVEMFVGVGASRVRDLFATARKNTPCIIFIDEIDAVGRARGSGKMQGSNDEREATLNQILTEMDGFNTTEQVVVMAGTNRMDVLDKALLRPGRFDRHITIDKPTMEGRKQIFAVHLGKIVTKEDLDQLKGRLATLTPGFSGADIANCVNEAALIAARNKADSVVLAHFEQAIERVIGGLERKSLVLSPEEKKTVAYHEAGHAICGWFFKYADPLLKVSIIPRGQGALGYAQYVPNNGDTYLMNAHQLMDRMAMTLGGRVSEELHFDTVTSGASDDFKKVTQMATAMVTRFGMSERIGPISFDDDGQQNFQKPFSEETGQAIDSEVRRIINDAYKQCRDLLTIKKKEVGIVAEELLRKEVLTRDDVIRLIGPRPFEDKGEFHKYFDGSRSDIGANPTGTPGSGTIPPDLPPPLGPVEPSPAPTVFKDWKDL